MTLSKEKIERKRKPIHQRLFSLILTVICEYLYGMHADGDVGENLLKPFLEV